MFFTKKGLTRTAALIIACVFLALTLTACGGGTEDTQSSEPAGQTGENAVKTKIDSLYKTAAGDANSTTNISVGALHSLPGEPENLTGTTLTNGEFSASGGEDALAFPYGNGSELIIKLPQKTAGICRFEINSFIAVQNKIIHPDEIKVSVSADGTEYTALGIMSPGGKGTGEGANMYFLALSGGAEAEYISFSFTGASGMSANLDEVSVYAYSNKESIVYDYMQYYGGKMPNKVTEPVFWEESDPDYAKKANLILGKTPQVFTMEPDIERESNSQPEDIYKLTDGVRTESSSYASPELFHGFSRNTNSDARLFVFDLEKTSAITGFYTGYVRARSAGVELPDSYIVYASEDGEAWDVVYRRDGIRRLITDDNALIKIEGEFDQAYKARFVAVFFDIEGHTRFDEIEIYGTKSAEGAKPVSGSGNVKLRRSGYPQPEEFGGINHMVLMYHCDASTISGSTPVTGGFTEESCLPLTGYTDGSGNISDTYFDTFLFIPGGGTENWVKADMWKVYLDNLFSEGYNLESLNSAAAKTGEATGNPSYKAKVVLSVFLTDSVFTEFGDLDGDGREEDFTKLEDKTAAIDWLLEQYISRFKAAGYSNLELAGFYWLSEEIKYADIYMPAAIRHTADKIHELGYVFGACPYQTASGFYDWYNLGVDVSILQPSYYFWNHTDIAMTKIPQLSRDIGMGVEMEVEADATESPEKLAWYAEYLRSGVEYGYMNGCNMYYHSVPFYTSAGSVSKLGRQLYDMNYKYIKGTLEFTDTQKEFGETISCAPGETVKTRIKFGGIDQKLHSAAKYGNLRFSADGTTITYTPFEGFEGEDSFFVEVWESGADRVVYEVKIKVG